MTHTIIDRNFCDNVIKELHSFKKLGLLLTIIGQENPCNFTTKDISMCSKEGIDTIRSGLNTLVKDGFVKYTRERKPGTNQFKRGTWSLTDKACNLAKIKPSGGYNG